MRSPVVMIVVMFLSCLVANARIAYTLSVKGAMAKSLLKVVDQDGVPVSDAKVWGAFSANRLKDSVLVDGVTDMNGEFVVQGNCNEFLRIDVTKEGYYHTEEKINFRQSKSDPIVVDGKWQPYGEKRMVVLKKICTPSHLIFSESKCSEIPVFDTWVGYDIEKGDWVAPHGKGVLPDMQLRFITVCNEGDILCRTMEVSFTNCLYAGAYMMSRDKNSEFDTVYHADTNAHFQTYFKYEFNHSKNKIIRNELSQEQYLVFRVRVKVDEKGDVTSAHYGKLMGNWKFFECNNMCIGRCFFNPTPNDTNLEDIEAANRSRDFIRLCEPPLKSKRK